MDAVLRSGPTLAGWWRRAMDGEHEAVRAMVDAVFTKGPDANGWLVLTREREVEAGFSQIVASQLPDPPPESCWNLAACLYNDRATVSAKVDGVFARLRPLGSAPYESATAEITAAWTMLNGCDGRGSVAARLSVERLPRVDVRHRAPDGDPRRSRTGDVSHDPWSLSRRTWARLFQIHR